MVGQARGETNLAHVSLHLFARTRVRGARFWRQDENACAVAKFVRILALSLSLSLSLSS